MVGTRLSRALISSHSALKLEHRANDGVRAHDVGDVGAGLLEGAEGERRPGVVHQVVDQRVRADLAVQRVRVEPVVEALDHLGREVGAQQHRGPPLVGQLGGEQRLLELELDVRGEHRELGRGQPGSCCAQRLELVVRGRNSICRSRCPAASRARSIRSWTGSMTAACARALPSSTFWSSLSSQHERGDLVGHLAEQCVALLARRARRRARRVEQDLDVDLVVRGVDAGGVVDRVGVDAPAGAARTRCAPRWVKPRLPPSPTTRQRSSGASMRTASFALSPTSASVSRDDFTYVPMPPFQSRSTGARRIALISSVGRQRARPSHAERARAPRGDSATDFGRARKDAAAAEISAGS